MRGVFVVLIVITGGGCWPRGDGAWDGVASDPCSPGNARSGEACSVPSRSILVDGDVADWQGVEVIPVVAPCQVPPCEGLAPAAVQLATTSDGWLAMNVRVQDAPPLRGEPTVQYVVEMTATDEFPSPERDRLLASAGEVHFTKNDYVVDPPAGVTAPYRFAWTRDGFEASMATAFLPFPAGARIAIYARRADQIVGVTTPLVRACWLTELVGEGFTDQAEFVRDPCRKRAP
jgi:hypothetical protein